MAIQLRPSAPAPARVSGSGGLARGRGDEGAARGGAGSRLFPGRGERRASWKTREWKAQCNSSLPSFRMEPGAGRDPTSQGNPHPDEKRVCSRPSTSVTPSTDDPLGAEFYAGLPKL